MSRSKVEKRRIRSSSTPPCVGRGFCTVHVNSGSVTVADNEITDFLFIQDNVVAGHLKVLRNSGNNPKTVTGNTVGKKIQCFDNDEPFVGGPNVAQKAEGQCF